MKKITLIVPCYNDDKSVEIIHDLVIEIFKTELTNYDYELIFCDDYSTDDTREKLKKICKSDKKTKANLNAKNFGFTRNVFHSLLLGTGDITFMFFGDMQDPPELLPQFIKLWEDGYKVIIGQKNQSGENPFVFKLRTMFYNFMSKISDVEQIQHFNGYGLYDKKFIDILKSIEDQQPYLKGIVSELAVNKYIFKYNQRQSSRGKSNFNFFKYYDVAMQGITSYTKILMRIATFLGGILGIFSILIAIYVFINKLLNWDSYPIGIPTVIIGVFFIGAIQLFFTGILGEYILSINVRTMKKPLVVYEEQLNFDE